MSRGGRKREPRITDLETYPRRYVYLRVAAEFLEMDVRTLDALIDDGTIDVVYVNSHRRIPIESLKKFHVQRHNAA